MASSGRLSARSPSLNVAGLSPKGHGGKSNGDASDSARAVADLALDSGRAQPDTRPFSSVSEDDDTEDEAESDSDDSVSEPMSVLSEQPSSNGGGHTHRTHSTNGSVVPPLLIDNGTISMPFMKEALQLFKKYDQDNSGTIDIDELRQLLNDMFAHNNMSAEFRNTMVEKFLHQYDRNKDGAISWQEFLVLFDREDLFGVDAAPSPPHPVGALDEPMWLREAHAMFRKYDTDNSGQIDMVELEALLNEVFAASNMSEEYRKGVIQKTMREYDRNHDGSISWKEFAVLFDKEDLIALRTENVPAVPFGIKDARRLFEKYDKNRSGTIDKKEIESLLREAFNLNPSRKMRDVIMQKYIEEYDVNGDGVISWEEFQILFAKEDFRTFARSLSETSPGEPPPPKHPTQAQKSRSAESLPKYPEVLPPNIRTVGGKTSGEPMLMISGLSSSKGAVNQRRASLDATSQKPATPHKQQQPPQQQHQRAPHTPSVSPVGSPPVVQQQQHPFGPPAASSAAAATQLPSIPGAKRDGDSRLPRLPSAHHRRDMQGSQSSEFVVEASFPVFVDKRGKPPELDKRRTASQLPRTQTASKLTAPPLTARRSGGLK